MTPYTLHNPNPEDIKNILYQSQITNWQNLYNSKTENNIFVHKKNQLSLVLARQNSLTDTIIP